MHGTEEAINNEYLRWWETATCFIFFDILYQLNGYYIPDELIYECYVQV